MLTAQPGLDCVSVSCWGSRASGPPGLRARLESEVFGWEEAPKVPAEPSCQEVSTRDSSALCLEFAIYQG